MPVARTTPLAAVRSRAIDRVRSEPVSGAGLLESCRPYDDVSGTVLSTVDCVRTATATRLPAGLVRLRGAGVTRS
ncbi:hypothetical protein BJY18_006559 [Amycolatopsis jiangsuensis]|uniref:Uncharacterized protein n=1 Tax=Amycolatopsis jiangsuensis TaxID=1181879 RepID=A0A840J6N9_9PSEU|nr:hypothetical protein [Amycolatopsis jiangsuensis]